jgi:hypothetical protein
MRTLSQRGDPRRYVGSGDGGTVVERGRLTRQAPGILGDADRGRLRGFYNCRQIGRYRGDTEHGAARPRRRLVMSMLGRLMRGVAGIGVMALLRVMMLMRCRMRGVIMRMRGGGRLNRDHQAGRGIAERKRDAGHEHAKQIEQGDKPPRFGALSSGQANEHGGESKRNDEFRQGTLFSSFRGDTIASNPESRDSGLIASRCPGMTGMIAIAAPSPPHLHAQYRGNVA